MRYFGAKIYANNYFLEKTGQSDKLIASNTDFFIWYAKNKQIIKYRQLYRTKQGGISVLEIINL